MIWFESLYRVTVNNLTMKAVCLIFIKSGDYLFYKARPLPFLCYETRGGGLAFYYIGNAFRQIGENIYIRELTLG